MSSPGQRPPGAFPTAEDDVEDFELYMQAVHPHSLEHDHHDEEGDEDEGDDEEEGEEEEDDDDEDDSDFHDEAQYDDMEDEEDEGEEGDGDDGKPLLTPPLTSRIPLNDTDKLQTSPGNPLQHRRRRPR